LRRRKFREMIERMRRANVMISEIRKWMKRA